MKHHEVEAVHGGGDGQYGLSTVVAAAHELKSPLVLLRQLSFAAADPNKTENERQLALQQLTLVADRGLRLTTDLTKTARLDSSMFMVEPISAQQVCETIVKQIRPLYDQHGRTIRLDVRRGRPLVLAHRELLSSIVYHFADNALHYGDDDSSVTVTLQAKQKQKKLRISVRDEGPAMSLADWRKVSREPGKSLSSRPQSSGLGLYIAEQFSQAMGAATGLIRHRNGATFYVEVPLSEQLRLL